MNFLIYVRTHYAHWAKRSGYCLLVEAIKRSGRFQVDEIVSKTGVDESNVIAEQTWQDGVMPWYKAGDQLTEARLAGALSKRAGGLVHFLDGEQGYYHSRRLAGNGVKLVATYHQPPGVISERGLLGDKQQLRALDRAIVLTEEQREYFGRYMDPGRIVVMPHGVDTEYFSPDGERPDGPVKLLSVGFWLRDFAVMSETVEGLRGRPIEYHVVGLKEGMNNGAVDPRLFTRIANAENVVVHDFISDDKLRNLYRIARILAMPLLDGTANNGLLEGAATGLAVVTTDLPGTRTMLTEDAGRFSPIGDSEGFRRNIEYFLDRPSEAALYGKTARTLMVDKYQWHDVARQYADLYDEICSEKKLFPIEKNFSKHAMCTVITSDYLSQAYALAKSVHAHGNTDFYALISDHGFNPEKLKQVRGDLGDRLNLLTIEDLKVALPKYDSEDSVRWALKAPFMLHLLERLDYDKVIFVDSDVCFFDNYDFLYEELESHGMLLTPHWRPVDPDTNPIQFPCNFLHGLYNAGFIGVSKAGLAPLKWWQTACYYKCEKTVTQGFYVDQRYLDVLPVRFDSVKVLRHKGCNVAEWNRDHALRVRVDGKTYVENWPVVFVHFSDITLAETAGGMDPCLLPLMVEYRAYFDEADKEVAVNNWNLRHPVTQDRSIASTRHEGPAVLCSVFDVHRVESLPALISSIEKHFDTLPNFHVCCADYDTYNLLKQRTLPNFCILHHWTDLKEYELAKQHGMYAGDQRRFTRVSQPFFLRFIAEKSSGTVLFMASDSMFRAYPGELFSAIGTDPTPFVMPMLKPKAERESFCRCGYCLAAVNSKDREFLSFWISQILKRKEWDKLVPGVEETFSVRIATREMAFFDPEDERVEVVFGVETDGSRSIFSFGSGEDIEAELEAVSSRDVLRAALRQGKDIHNFGRQESFQRSEEPSGVHMAYALYLVAVMYREDGREAKAKKLLTVLCNTPMGLPDMYRSKAFAHLGALVAGQGDRERGASLLKEALCRFPGNKEAASWLKNTRQ